MSTVYRTMAETEPKRSRTNWQLVFWVVVLLLLLVLVILGCLDLRRRVENIGQDSVRSSRSLHAAIERNRRQPFSFREALNVATEKLIATPGEGEVRGVCTAMVDIGSDHYLTICKSTFDSGRRTMIYLSVPDAEPDARLLRDGSR